MGNPRIAPALPIIPLPDTNLPLTLDNAEYEWKTLIAQVRSTHPAIKLFWIIEVPSLYHYSPQFLENFDGFYVLLNPPVTFTGDTTPQNLTDQIGKFLDENLFPIWEQTNKPLILAVQIPSTDVAGMGCIDPTNTCTSFTILDQFSAYPVSGVNFEVQAFVYQSYFQAISQRKWVGGFVSRGFYPPVILRDISSSIRGKPAEEVAGYWFPRLLLQTK
ncbi:MAG: hypothetical protein IT308_13035 [Anaerolineaceae bacterium]|nr:hypothetical protein [Anaerolineaceae bacterium]